jgi:tetratricopeptide (TPR) repeat protein
MGVVLLAYDPELARCVAIKVIAQSRHTPLKPERRAALRASIFREARALARISHPNVVTVYDVGSHGDSIYLVMEYVRGPTLRAWLDAGGHSPAEVMRVMIAAGQGLCAAHRAGLTHRDFKPENVIVEDGGRVVVMDFGLVQGSGHEALLTADSDDLPQSPDETRAFCGTVAYSPPEQLLSRHCDARTDQFAFCVALFEALWHQRPFAAGTVAELLHEINQGPIWPKAAQTFRQAKIRTILRRGLAGDPDARFASMEELLASLTAAENAGRVRTWSISLLCAALIAGGLVIGQSDKVPAVANFCAPEADLLSAIWNEETSGAIAVSLARAGKQDVSRWKKIDADLARYMRDWQGARESACHPSERLRAPGFDLQPRQFKCLELRRNALRSLVSNLSAAPDMMRQNESLVARLPSTEDCTDVDRLRTDITPPRDPQARARFDEIRNELVQNGVKVTFGRSEENEARALYLANSALEVGSIALAAEVTNGLASMQADLDPVVASDAARRGFLLSLAAGNAWTSTHAALLVAWTTGVAIDAPEEDVRELLSQARAQVVGADDPPNYALLVRQFEAFDQRRRGHHERALASMQEALAYAERTHVRRPYYVAWRTYFVGVFLATVDQMDRAYAMAKRGFELWVAYEGLNYYPTIEAEAFANQMEFEVHPSEAAFAREEDILARLRRLYPDGGPPLLSSMMRLAQFELDLGRHEQARARLKRAILESTDRSANIAWYDAVLHGMLGQVEFEAGECSQAQAHLEQAVGVFSPEQLAHSVSGLRMRVALARTLAALGQFEQAFALLRPADDGDFATELSDLQVRRFLELARGDVSYLAKNDDRAAIHYRNVLNSRGPTPILSQSIEVARANMGLAKVYCQSPSQARHWLEAARDELAFLDALELPLRRQIADELARLDATGACPALRSPCSPTLNSH